MSEREHLDFERKLALHTAPTLLGIKCGGLFSLPSADFDIPENIKWFNRRAAAKKLKIRDLRGGDRALILVYNERLLEKRLREAETRELLKRCGYLDHSLEYCLDRLSERFKTNDGFPHEVGVFLGYPIEDIIGFIENHGSNFKLCGCWKVYGNERNAVRAFDDYEKCKRFLCGKLDDGVDIYRVLKIKV